MATLKDWVRSNVAWDWMKANGYQTFCEHDELVKGVDEGIITEEQLYHEDGFNFPRMPEDWKSFEEIRDEEEATFAKEMGIDPNAPVDDNFVIITGKIEK